MRRLPKKWEARVSIQGQRILLGCYEYRSDAVKAEDVAITIRKALDRAESVRKFKEAQERP